MRAEAEKAGLNNAILVNTAPSPPRPCARPTGDPPGAARKSARPHHRHGCAAQTEKKPSPKWRRWTRCSATRRSSPAPPIGAADFGVSAEEKLRVNGHHERARHRTADGEAHRRARARLHPGAETAATTAAPSASFPMAAAIRAPCRWAPSSTRRGRLAESGYREIVLTGSTPPATAPICPERRPSGFSGKTLLKQVPEILRLRLSSIDSIEADGTSSTHRRGAALHAASASFSAARRRPDPEAHEAAAFGAPMRAPSATRSGACARDQLRCGHDRRISDRDRRCSRTPCGSPRIAASRIFTSSPIARARHPAARMPQLDRALVKERAARLRAKGAELHAATSRA